MIFKHFIRNILPYFFVERRRRLFRLHRLGLSPSCGTSQEYEAAVNGCRFELWPAVLRTTQDWTLVDVGANEGDFIRATTRLANPSAVFAFEPLPSCQPALSKLLASVRGGQLICAAVGAATGEVKLHCTANTYMSSVFPPQRGIDSSYADGDYGVVQQLSVPQVKLDDAIPPGMHIDLLKVDVQGYEREVLRGATRTLKETGALLIEVNYTPHYKGAVSFDELHAFLNAVGFHLHGISTPYFDDIRPLWADAMYVRKD